MADPDHPSLDYQRRDAKFQRNRDLWDGTDALRERGKTYLPLIGIETEDFWKARRDRTFLTNVFKDIVLDIVGAPFSKLAELKDMPPAIEAWAEDINLAGDNFHTVAAQGFEDGIIDGEVGFFVDFPTVADVDGTRPREITLRQQIDLDMRPYVLTIPARDLLAYRTSRVGGRDVVTHVRFRLCTIEQDPRRAEFEEREVTRVVELNPGTFVIHVQDPDRGWMPEAEGTIDLPEIPFRRWRPLRDGSPPLDDVSHLNVAHWQSSSEQRNNLSAARFAMLSGPARPVDAEGKQADLTMGPLQYLPKGAPNDSYDFVEPSGAALAAGREDLKDLEAAMRMKALRLHLPDSGDIPATAFAISAASGLSAVQRFTISYEQTWREIFNFIGLRGNVEASGDVELNKDSSLPLMNTDAQTLMQMAAQGMISQQTLWFEFQRRGILSDKFDPDEERNLIEESGFGLPRLPMDDDDESETEEVQDDQRQ